MKKAFKPYPPGMGTHGIKKANVCPDEGSITSTGVSWVASPAGILFSRTMTGNLTGPRVCPGLHSQVGLFGMISVLLSLPARALELRAKIFMVPPLLP